MQALVVDDSKATRMILRQILKQIGLEIAEAANGQEALRLLQRLDRIAVVLVDWNMPDMDGLAFVRTVRADCCRRDTRLVMVSSEQEAAQMRTALEAGADDYIRKPFTPEILRARLQHLGITPT